MTDLQYKKLSEAKNENEWGDKLQKRLIGLITRREFQRWFESPEDLWVLDWERWSQSYEDAGFKMEKSDSSERGGIAVVNEDSASEFIDFMSRDSVELEVLKDRLVSRISKNPEYDWFDVADLFPTLRVDFDKKSVHVTNYESTSLESYIPEGWLAISEGSYDFIPEKMRYWIIDGEDLFERILRKG